MRMLCVFFCAFLILISGCVIVSKDVALLAMEVSQVQQETSTALIKSIDDDIKIGNKSEGELKVLLDLKDRLDYLRRGNRAINRGMSNDLSMKEFASLLKRYNRITIGEKP